MWILYNNQLTKLKYINKISVKYISKLLQKELIHLKKRIVALALTLCVMLAVMTAGAEGKLTARIEEDRLIVVWSAGCSGDCTLTIYQNNWPVRVCGVNGSGSMEIPLNGAPGRYSVRLKTADGCLTAEAGNRPAPEPTPAPTDEPRPTEAPKPTDAPTAEPKPSEAPKPTAVPSAEGTNRSDLAAEVIRQVNEERAKQGLGPLRQDAELTRAACIRAREITQKFSHTRPDGTSWSTVSGAAYGENIARGQRTADKVMAAWLTSQGHRENILRASYGSIGVCAIDYNGVIYWVQLFGK